MQYSLALLLILSVPAVAQSDLPEPLQPITVTEWKAVYGRIEARDRVPARARIGGTLVQLGVSEGDAVSAGEELATVVDEKIVYQLRAIDAQLQALDAQLENARTELARGEELLSRGVTTTQRLDTLRTQVDIFTNQIESARANRSVVEQQAAEGKVLAPIAGRILTVPVTQGSVLLPGEAVATLAGGGFFLRLAVPERHAGFLKEGDEIVIETAEGSSTGHLAKLYPLIENGRVVADVEVENLPDTFVDARVLVRLPVGERQALVVPASAIVTRSGLDFVEVMEGGEAVMRTVVLGERRTGDGAEMVEVLTGLEPGNRVVSGHE